MRRALSCGQASIRIKAGFMVCLCSLHCLNCLTLVEAEARSVAGRLRNVVDRVRGSVGNPPHRHTDKILFNGLILRDGARPDAAAASRNRED